ncbi:nuclease [Bacillus phage vB_BceS_LY1]|uniref:Nuclease n=1 Tax=Bacillus phage vB_BceS_LY1 TaxID=2950459 RepID=A0AAE9S2F4_9CAUD|nr:nuclease [Bacillus phage vB_BceS_LY1]
MSKVNHGERDHALLSASGASRWINCPPSARLTDAIPDNRNSEYAKQGEAAHEYSEHILRAYLSGHDGADVQAVQDFEATNPYFDEEMLEKVSEYVDYVIETYEKEEEDMLTTYMAIETELDYSNWAEDGFGTGDILIVNDERLHVIDLKYGKGVHVSAEDNSQLKMYALGAMNHFKDEYDFKDIVLHICQPRLGNFSTFEINAIDLLKWAQLVVRPAAKLAFAGEGEFKAGDHCRWCKVKGNCNARAEENLKALEYEFQEPALIPDEDIGTILHLAMQLKAWAGDVESYVKKQVLQGKQIDGWKQVKGRSSRKFTDVHKVQARLEDDLIDEEVFLKEPEMKSLSVIEKALGKKAFKELLGDLIEVSEGSPTLAPASDPRKAVNTIQADFADEEWED